MRLNLQYFAEGTANQNKAARSYQKQFKQLLQAVFRTQAYFRDFFGGEIEALDGVQHNDTAFYVKTSDIPVVVGTEYNKDPDTAFGSGTGNSTRFGPRTEIIYQDTPVPYTWEWVYHEGIDRHTVNNDFQAAVADRLDLQAQAKIKKFNAQHSKFISSTAARTETLSGYENDPVLELFNTLDEYYTNIEAIGTKVAKVNAKLYNAIVDHPLTTSAKSSSANIDQNRIITFKDFAIEKSLMQCCKKMKWLMLISLELEKPLRGLIQLARLNQRALMVWHCKVQVKPENSFWMTTKKQLLRWFLVVRETN